MLVTAYDYEEPIAKALAAGVINDIEAKLVREAKQLVSDALQVDVFPGDAAVTSDSGDVAHAG